MIVIAVFQPFYRHDKVSNHLWECMFMILREAIQYISKACDLFYESVKKEIKS